MSQEITMSKIKLELAIEETNIILEALGQLPFVRVYALIGRIQEQARAQVGPADPRGVEEKQSHE